MPSNVFVTVTAAAPAWVRAGRDLDDVSDMRGEFRPHRAVGFRDHGAHRGARCRRRRARTGAHLRRGSDNSGSTRSRRCRPARPASCAAAFRYSSTVRPQMLTTTPRSGALQRGQVIREPRVDARALEADAVQHASRRLVQPRRGIAGPRLRRERLHDHGAEPLQREVRPKFGTVSTRPRRRHHRIRQLDIADLRSGVNHCGIS